MSSPLGQGRRASAAVAGLLGRGHPNVTNEVSITASPSRIALVGLHDDRPVFLLACHGPVCITRAGVYSVRPGRMGRTPARGPRDARAIATAGGDFRVECRRECHVGAAASCRGRALDSAPSRPVALRPAMKSLSNETPEAVGRVGRLAPGRVKNRPSGVPFPVCHRLRWAKLHLHVHLFMHMRCASSAASDWAASSGARSATT